MTRPNGAAELIAELEHDIQERIATPQQRLAWQNQIDNMRQRIPPPPPRLDHYVCQDHRIRYGVDPTAPRLPGHCGCETSNPSSPSSSLWTKYTYDSGDGTR